MRVLWFTNTFVPGKEQSETETLRATGGWMVALYKALQRQQPDLSLAIVTARPASSAEAYRIGNVDCFVVPTSRSDNGRSQAQALNACAAIVRQWRPDVIHIHGTERFFGLLSARKLVAAPTVISVQGLLGPYSEWYHYFGNRTLRDIARMHRWVEPIALRGPLWGLRKYRQGAKMEREIIRGNVNFMGRTLWDHAHVMAMNPKATYYTAGELLRQPFWDCHWSLERCSRHRILFANAGHPRKGLEVLLDVIPLLKSKYPDIHVRVAGSISRRSGYGRYIRRRLRSLGNSVTELGALNAEEMAAGLVRSHVFVSPSFIDNSPNAVCEAQLVGMPVIAAYTGGVPSLIEEGRTGLFFPTGDVPVLAARVQEVFEDDKLAERLAAQAHDVACRRHDPEEVVRQVLIAYKDVLSLVDDRNAMPVRLSI